jgi:mono/diheme cytochrome c family protein
MMWLALLFFQPSAQQPELAGAKVFATSCAVGYCHGADGAANRGPRLRGREFDRAYVERVVHKGIPNSAMPGFEGRLKPGELAAVIAYVMHISGEKHQAAPSSITSEPAEPARVMSPAEALFFDATREVRCATCHELGGRGVKIAPMDAKDKVKRVKLRDGDSFPALIVSDTSEALRVYDLTVPPPVLRTLDRMQVAEIGKEELWNHSQVTRKYTQPEVDQVNEFLGTERH